MRRPILAAPVRRRPPDFSLAIVNIVLLLVFFFLITGSLMQNGEMRIDLAYTKTLPVERLPRPLLLIDAAGTMALDGVPVDADALAPALDRQGARALYLLADADLPAAAMMALTARPDLERVTIRLVTLRIRKAAL